MATYNAGLALKRNIGLVQPGMDADLVVLRANPLEALAATEQIELVIKGGNVFRK